MSDLNPVHAAILLENSTYSRKIYRAGTVDWAFFDDAVVLHEGTADHLYSEFTPLDQPYVCGSRPFLERIVESVTAGLQGDREKAIALNDWVRRLSITYPNPGREVFSGGSEEEVVKKGSNMCNEMARVLIVLAQIAGIPSRYIGHMPAIDYDDPASGSGHGVTELYVEGRWSYFDIRGKFFEKRDGTLASTWELLKDQSIMDNQPEHVVRWRDKTTSVETSRKWMVPRSVTIVRNYLAADHAKYDYTWTYFSPELVIRAREAARRIRTTKHKDLLPQPVPRVG